MGENAIIAGVDEAGRGALAGPVVAGACILGTEKPHRLIKDSKQLSPEQRDEAFEWIQQHCFFGFGIVSQEVIDSKGILFANENAMQMAIASLAEAKKPTYLLIDGNDKFWFDYPHTSIIRGDQTEPCISAASIVAKVTRDRLMIEYAKEHPQYGFDSHKGYGAPMHIEAIQSHGPCVLHRRSYITRIWTGATATATETLQTGRLES